SEVRDVRADKNMILTRDGLRREPNAETIQADVTNRGSGDSSVRRIANCDIRRAKSSSVQSFADPDIYVGDRASHVPSGYVLGDAWRNCIQDQCEIVCIIRLAGNPVDVLVYLKAIRVEQGGLKRKMVRPIFRLWREGDLIEPIA